MKFKLLAVALSVVAVPAYAAMGTTEIPTFAGQAAAREAAKHATPQTPEEWLARMTDFTRNLSAFKDPKVFIGLLVGFSLMSFLHRAVVRTRAGAYVQDLCFYNLPLFHQLIQEGAAARFARTFGLLLQSGVPLLQALNLVGNAAGNLVITRAVEKVASQVSEGARLSEKLDEALVFPDLMVQMASIGEEAGFWPEMFALVARYYEEEGDPPVSARTAGREPAMMVLVGGLVCFLK